jgi:hypothetical protein
MTKQVFVADEQLAVITHRNHELMKRLLAGGLDPARVAAGLQQIIEGKMPADGDPEAFPRRKHWVSIHDARQFGEALDYTRAAVGLMYGQLIRQVTRRASHGVTPPLGQWTIEHRGDEYGQPPSMEFERTSLIHFVESGSCSFRTGWGNTTKRLFLAWIDHLKEEG